MNFTWKQNGKKAILCLCGVAITLNHLPKSSCNACVINIPSDIQDDTLLYSNETNVLDVFGRKKPIYSRKE